MQRWSAPQATENFLRSGVEAHHDVRLRFGRNAIPPFQAFLSKVPRDSKMIFVRELLDNSPEVRRRDDPPGALARPVGARGEGKWERVSWENASNDIADAILDAVQEQGPQSLYHIGTPGEGGTQQILWNNFSAQLGFSVTDLQAEINDFSPGIYTTFGKFDPAPGADDFFHSELILIWHANPVYTNITWYHFIQEARYNGGEVVTIAPDFSPSAVHADLIQRAKALPDNVDTLMAQADIDGALVGGASLSPDSFAKIVKFK